MNRNELVSALVESSGQDRAAAEGLLAALADVVGEALRAGEKVTLPGLLTAETVERAERQGRNPQTGEPLTIAATTGVRLRAVPALKDRVKGH